MRNLSLALVLSLAVPLVGCTVGNDSGGGVAGDTSDGTSDGTTGGTPDGATPSTDISGIISVDTTWTGEVVIGGGTTIAAGKTVTVEAGTTISMKPGANISVLGTLDLNGTSAAKVTIKPTGTGFGGISVGATGAVHMKYALQTGGALSTNGGGAVITLEDTKLFKTSGDFLILNGGSITATYSQIGPSEGESDTTHCQLHFNSATAISITHSNINGAPYGVMFFGGTMADFKSNNWFGNTTNVATQPGVSGDFSNGYFAGGPPVAGNGATITANTLSATKLLDAGVRP